MTSEPEDLGLVDGLVQLSFLVQSVLSQCAAAHDITVPQLRLMGILRDREPGMLQLARYLGLDKSSVSGLIDRAERRGLVKRTTTADDGRAVLVSTTAAGRDLTERVSEDVAIRIRALGATLSAADRKMLSLNASRIVQAHAGPTMAKLR